METTSTAASAAAPSAKPATGGFVPGRGFTLNVPAGWEQRDESQVTAASLLAIAIDPTDADGFADNMIVAEDPSILKTGSFDDVSTAAEQALRKKTDRVEVLDPIKLADEPAVVITASLTQGAVKYATVQYVTAHADIGYVVTFSFSAGRPMAEQIEIASSVAASWQWTS